MKNEIDRIKLLLVEDDDDFSLALTARLAKRGFNVVSVGSAEEALSKLDTAEFEVIVADLKLPGMDGMSFLAKVRELKADLPVVLVTGYGSLESVKEAVKLNAADYILKPLECIDELLNPVYKAVHGFRLVQKNKELLNNLQSKISELEKSKQKYKDLFEFASDMIFIINTEGVITSVNKRMEEVTGYTKDELIGKKANCLFGPIVESRYQLKIKEVFAGKLIETAEVNIITKSGCVRLGEIGMRPIKDRENITGIECIIRDITERKVAEKELMDSRAELQQQKLVLEQKNIALKEILEQIEIEKNRMKDDIITNVEALFLPALETLKWKLDAVDRKYIDLLQSNLENITSSFGRKITTSNFMLSPREKELCNMIKNGLTSKEISELLNISIQTTERHRNNIRKKLKITNKEINLNTYLQTL